MKKIGKYVIIEELGKGGMGIIYKARDPDIDREVAIKTIKEDFFAQSPYPEKTLKQFRLEAKAAGRLSHANIATIYEVGKKNDMTFIVMQYIPGQSLRQIIQSGKKFNVDEIVHLMAQVCRGLDYAHKNGIVHRDIKPENILIDKEGKPYIVDFGIATIESFSTTLTNTTKGTLAYMSPEQIQAAQVDYRTDIFSLGIVIYELLSGKRPFSGDSAYSIQTSILNEEPARLDLGDGFEPPEDFEGVLRKALAKKPEDRFRSCAEFASALEELTHPTVQTTVIKKTVLPAPVEKKTAKSPWAELLRTKTKWAVLPIAAAVVIAGVFLLKKKSSAPDLLFDNLIAITSFQYKTQDIPTNLVEYLLERSLTAAVAKYTVFTQSESGFLDKQKDSMNAKRRIPVVQISGKVDPTVTGFEITVNVVYKNKKGVNVFACKGPLDLISNKINDIMAVLSEQTSGDIGKIEGGRNFSQICTANWDALTHFLRGQTAWGKLEKTVSDSEFKTALENDPDFSLARLKRAEVFLFDEDREQAKSECEKALAKKDRLINYDILRLEALMARIESKPKTERSILMKLSEDFPLKKEYRYEVAESYFHCGDGEPAIEYYSKALKIDPNYSLAHNHIGYCYSWIGDHKQAVDHLQTYVRLDNTGNSYDSLATGYMFAGQYGKALEELEKGRKLEPNLDNLYSNFAANYQLIGALGKAVENIQNELNAASREASRFDAQFKKAYVEYLRGNFKKAEDLVQSAREYYSGLKFTDSLDESPILPFWLTGVLAAKRNDLAGLGRMIANLQGKVTAHGVNATDYFPVYKFYIHLKVLEGLLQNNMNAVLKYIEEGERIKKKMGYWGSPYNMAYFLDQFAAVLMEANASSTKPEVLLKEVLGYNENYAPAHINLAQIYLRENKKEEAKRETRKARQILANADQDFFLLKELAQIEKKAE
jgi:serine/threonine protein kinase/tetratricopeptide (TPR) repeat protein